MKRKFRYSKDYEIHERESSRPGKYKKEIVYTGEYYTFNLSAKEKLRFQWISTVVYAFLSVVFGAIGVLNNDGSRMFYVVMPYVFLFLPLFYGWMGIFRLFTLNQPMTRIECDHSVERMKKSTLGILVMSITSGLGEIIYLFTHKNIENVRKEIFFLSGILFLTFSSLLVFQVQKKIVVKKENK